VEIDLPAVLDYKEEILASAVPRCRSERIGCDLSAVIGFDHWVLDLQSPGLLRMTQNRMGGLLQEANAQPKFAPSACPHFFEPWGWRPEVVRSLLKTAARLKRLSF
jgi:hypothetical protein